MPAPASNEAVSAIIRQCLAPRPQDRPTAAQVRDVLTGRAAAAGATAAPAPASAAPAAPAAPPPVAPAPAAPPVAAAPPPAAPASPPPAPPPPSRPAVVADAPPAVPPAPRASGGRVLTTERIQLVGESGHAIAIGVRTPLGKHMVRQFGDDAAVWDAEQATVERGPDGAWIVVPRSGTTNETLLNGAAITSPQPLRDGDVIAVGRAAKGIEKLPLTARPG